MIKSTQEKVSVHTISDYIGFLKEAFFIHECPVFSYKKNDLLKSVPKKIYLNDPVFVKPGQGFSGFGKLLENLVYMELKRRGGSVSTFKIGNKEVDFLYEKKDKKLYYQVAWTIGDTNSETYHREFGNLMKIKDHFPKYVISADPVSHPNNCGIRHVRAIDFFMGQEE